MNVKEFRELCKYASMGGLVNECYIAEKTATAINIERTAISIIEHDIKISQPIFISNIAVRIDEISEYDDNQEIVIDNNRLCINISKTDFYSVPLAMVEEPKHKITKLPDESYQVIAKNIDHNIINSISKSIKKSMESLYVFQVIGDDLCIVIGENISATKNKLIGKVQKHIDNSSFKFVMNIQECCKNLNHTVDIYFTDIGKRHMLMECNINDSNIHKVQYFIAATVEKE